MTVSDWLPAECVNVPFEEYASWNALNWSKVKNRAHSAAMFRWAETSEDEETVARAKGRATHCLILEPHNFDREFAIWRGGETSAGKWSTRRGTTAHKEWSATIAKGRTEITEDEYDQCKAMADAVRSHALTADLFDGRSATEVSMRYTDPATSLRCKARLDLLYPVGDGGVIVDVKGMPDIREFVVASQVAKQQWHGQGAHYCHAVHEVLGWKSVTYFVLGVQINKVHDVGMFELGTWTPDGGAIEYIHAGDILRRELLDAIAADRKRGTYPGRYDFPIPLDPPAWAVPDYFNNPFMEGDDVL